MQNERHPMADKKKDISAGTEEVNNAAGSIGAFFKQLNWEVVSFFPNSPCVRNKKNPKDK